jgi:hypothetical protein
MIFVDTNSDSGSSFPLEAERRANEFIKHRDVTGYFRSYPADEYGGESALDPLLHYWYQKVPNPDEIMVFQDWGIEDQNVGSVEANSIYTGQCFDNPVEEWPDLEIARNSTFEKAFWTSWSRALLRSLQFGHFEMVKPGEILRFFARQNFFVFLLASEFRSV